MDLDGKLSQLKMSMGSCNMNYNQNVGDASTCTTTTKASTCVSDAEDITSENSVDSDHDKILDDE